MSRLHKILNGIKQSVLRCDLLACSPTLRVRGEPAYQSVLGGILSFLIMGAFIVIFFYRCVDIIDKVDISATMSSTDNTESQTDITGIQLAVSIEGMQLGSDSRHFDIDLEMVNITGNIGEKPDFNRTQIQLEPCTLSKWQDIGNNFKGQFNALGMSKMLCIKDPDNIVLRGYEGSANYIYLALKIKACTNQTGQTHPCYDKSVTKTYIDNHLKNNDFFKVRFFIVDTRITPGDTQPVTKVLEKKIFLSFTDQLGTKGFISFAPYTITTDDSITPLPNQNNITGNYIHKYSTSTTGLKTGRYVYVEIIKATEELLVSREVSKIDDMISYLGGLFSLLWVGVAFFLASFNQYRYELYASEAAFTFDDSGRKIKEKDFGLITYIGYSIYDWLNTFGLAPHCWTKMRQIDEAREEICEQLDVSYLFRKIRSLQKTTACLLSQNKRICSMLTRQPTLEETQRERKLLELYSKLNPSPCQTHFKNKQNQVQNNGPQLSGQNFAYNEKFNNQIQMQSEIENMSCVSDFNPDQDEDFCQIMDIIRDSYAQMEGQNDEICKRIKEKIPSAVKRAMQKKQSTRKLIVEDLANKRFQSCENSFLDAKLK